MVFLSLHLTHTLKVMVVVAQVVVVMVVVAQVVAQVAVADPMMYQDVLTLVLPITIRRQHSMMGHVPMLSMAAWTLRPLTTIPLQLVRWV